MRIDHDRLFEALHACVEASPTARAHCGELVQRLAAQAHPEHLGPLTRLACAMESDEVWNRVQTLIHKRPSESYRVVAAAPWDALAETVRAAILERADSDICTAVAVARGRTIAAHITCESCTAFFAAIDPKVWDALDGDAQRPWLHMLLKHEAHLAVRSLGLRPEILTVARLSNDLIAAARRHAPGTDALRWALFPVALRSIDPIDRRALIASLPTMPPDPSAFFVIAGGSGAPSVIAHAQDTLHTVADLACAVLLQSCTDSNLPVRISCETLQDMVRGRSWNDLAPIMALLSDAARAALIPDRDALVERLARPDRKEAMRQALERLASLPPEIAIPTHVALTALTQWKRADAAEEITRSLCAHGDLFLSLLDALADNDMRTAFLPLPEKSDLADALRGFARDDVQTACNLAHALHDGSWYTALRALITAPPHHFGAIWRALDDAACCAIADEIAKAPQSLISLVFDERIIISDPIAAMIRASWDTLPEEARASLRMHHAFADLPLTPAHSAGQSPHRRWRM